MKISRRGLLAGSGSGAFGAFWGGANSGFWSSFIPARGFGFADGGIVSRPLSTTRCSMDRCPPSTHAGNCPTCGHEFSLADLKWMAVGDGWQRWVPCILPDGTRTAVTFDDYAPWCMTPLVSHLPSDAPLTSVL